MRAESVKDLGVIFDQKLTFSLHIQETVLQCNKVLGCIIRTAKYISDLTCLKVLYNSFVRSKLEYCSCVWNPSTAIDSGALERVQKRFLRILYFKETGIYLHYKTHPVSSATLMNKYEMSTVESRRDSLDMIFLHKLLTAKIDCSLLLELLTFNMSAVRNRRRNMFYLNERYLDLSALFRIVKSLEHIDLDLLMSSKLTDIH